MFTFDYIRNDHELLTVAATNGNHKILGAALKGHHAQLQRAGETPEKRQRATALLLMKARQNRSRALIHSQVRAT